MRDAVSSTNCITVDDETLRHSPLPQQDDGDKEDRGRVLLIAGSREIPGAAVLAATAALRAGAGKVTIGTAASIAQSMAFAVPEARVIALEESPEGGIGAKAARPLEALAGRVRAVLIGPGLTDEPATCALAAWVLKTFPDAAIVFDAGAMHFVCTPPYGGTRFSSPVLLTPHAGEMASLTGASKEDVAANPVDAALDAARTWNAVVALKGAVTYIAAPDGRLWRHEGGNFGLATSGSGDVLSGIIAGLAARGAPLEQASVWGVALHARAGERLAERCGVIGYLAREIAGEVPALMAQLAKSQREV
jgi:hydroxyethylthiazole kinase-like uncharacterized protein yjeF